MISDPKQMRMGCVKVEVEGKRKELIRKYSTLYNDNS